MDNMQEDFYMVKASIIRMKSGVKEAVKYLMKEMSCTDYEQTYEHYKRWSIDNGKGDPTDMVDLRFKVTTSEDGTKCHTSYVNN